MKKYIAPSIEYIQLQAEESIATNGSACKFTVNALEAENTSPDFIWFW